MALLVCRVSQKFVPLISCAIPFDQNYTFTRKFFKIVFALLSACIGKFNIPHAAVCFLSHSVAVAALSRIRHLACRARDFLLGLSEPSFQILHGVRSWIFIDTFIHYAPQFLHTVCSWRILGPAYCRYKIWQVVVVVVVFFLYHAWVALAVCAGAQSWTRHSKSGLTCYAEEAWLSWDPQTISFFGLGSWNRYLRHPSEKKKSSYSSAVRFCTA